MGRKEKQEIETKEEVESGSKKEEGSDLRNSYLHTLPDYISITWST